MASLLLELLPALGNLALDYSYFGMLSVEVGMRWWYILITLVRMFSGPIKQAVISTIQGLS